MRLSGYIQRTRALGDTDVSAHEIDAIGGVIEDGADLAAVLERRSKSLSPRALLGIWRASKRHAEHLRYLQRVRARRREKGQSDIAPAMLMQTTAAHEVALLERAVEMCPPGQVPEHRRRDAVKEALSLWKACLLIMRREGRADVELVTEDEALKARYGHLVGDTTLHEIDPAMWLAIRAGVREGALELTFDMPTERLVEQVAARGTAELSALAHGRNAEELLHDLVLVDLDEWAMMLKDDEARLLTLRDVGAAYHELLTAPRATQQVVAGAWPAGEGRIGVAVVLRDGRVVGHGVVDAGDAPVAAVEQVLGTHPVEAIVLPEAAEDEAALAALTAAYEGGELALLRVSAEAMQSALAAVEEELEPAAGAAAVLARRAVRPLKYWAQVDPLELSLAQDSGVEEDALRETLAEMRTLAQAGVKPADLARPANNGAGKKAKAPPKPLNPAVKSVDDLRPGMQVNGVVTNITQFGAFVNIGLSHEGLVHVSELADHFVNDPKDVVSVHQEVSARVLGVDRARRRISLSLRPERTTTSSSDGKERVLLDDIPGGRGRGGGGANRRSGFGGDRPRQGATGASRSQALADLEALFKKK